MISRKKKRVLIIVSIIVLLIIIATTLILLYINTDMFRSNATLFAKYMGQNIENMDTIYQKIGESESNQFLEQNKYTTKTQMKINYIEGIGTTSENSENSINQLKLNVVGQTDKSNQYNYQDIHLVKNDQDITELEYIQDGNIHGIKFSDLFNQYVVVNNENLKSLFEKMGYDEESLANIPNTIEFDKDLKSDFQLSEEEKQTIQTNYMNIINSNVSKDRFSKQAKQMIQVDGNNVSTNAYTLTLTKEQMNDLIIKILEQIKQDEIILTRIDKIETMPQVYQTEQTTSLREQFIANIEDIITKITRNNIGQEEAKITVYENNQITLKTVIQNPDYEINIDFLPLQEGNYMSISYQDKAIEQVLTYKNTKEETSVNLKNTKDKKTTEYSLLIEEKINNNNCTKNITARYEDDSNKVEAIIEQEMDIVNRFDEEVILNNENSINLSNLEKEQLQSILQQINDKVSERVMEITTTDIDREDLWKILKTLGLVKEEQSFESIGITETEKNRFNSKFEILQADELKKEEVLRLIDAVKENLVDIEVVSSTELKLKLERSKKNEEVASNLISFVEKNENGKYNAKVEYDEETGLVKDIVLTMLQERR